MQPAPAGSLLAYLEQIPDPRGRQGRRHACSAMLAGVVCAILCGARGYSGITQWIHTLDLEWWHALGFNRTPPKLGAIRKLLMKLPEQSLDDALYSWVEQLLPGQVNEAALQAMAMDGGSSSDVIASPELLSLVPERNKKQQWRSLLEGHATHHIGLPAVISVLPRPPAHLPSRTTMHNKMPAR